MTGDVRRRLADLEKRLRPPREVEPIRRDGILEGMPALVAWRILYDSGGRDLVETIFLEMQPDEPLLAELFAALEKVELLDEAERIVRER